MVGKYGIEPSEDVKHFSCAFISNSLHPTFTDFTDNKEQARVAKELDTYNAYGLAIQILEVGLLLALLNDKDSFASIKQQLVNRNWKDTYFPWIEKMVVQAAVIEGIYRNAPGSTIEIATPSIRRDKKYDFLWNGHPVICRVSRSGSFCANTKGLEDKLPIPGNPRQLDKIPAKLQDSYDTCLREMGEAPLIIMIPLKRTKFSQGYNDIIVSNS